MLRSLLFLWAIMPGLVRAADTLAWKKLPPLPDATGVAAPFAGITGGALLVAGGANFPGKMPWEGGKKVWHDRVWILENPDGEWREGGKLPRPLAYGISVTWHDEVICVGGSDASRHYAYAIRLNWKGGVLAVSPLPALPIPLAGACGALIDDVLYVAGGSDEPGEQSASRRGFKLELAAEPPAWRELPPIPGKGRLFAAGAVHDGTFYVLGGAALEPTPDGKIGRTYLREAWSFSDHQGWQRRADLPKAIVAAPSPAPVMGGRILLIAGDDGSRTDFQPLEEHPGFPAQVLEYEIQDDRWILAGETPAPRATVPVVKWGEAFVFPSGEVRPGRRSPEVWTLSPR